MSRNHGKRGKAGGWTPDDAPRRDGPRARRDAPRDADNDGPVWIWGTHAVTAALANPDRYVHTLLVTDNAAERLGPTRVPAQTTTARELDHRLPVGAVHQGVALRADPLDPADLDDVIGCGAKRLVILDSVSDPHNLGAVFRSAAAFGFDGLILQTRVAPPITGVVAKSAAGAIETVEEIRVVNLARALDALGEAGYHTVGLAGEATRNLADAVRGAEKLVIVLGAEGEGIRPAVAKACSELARIPIASAMESLNVSNAAAIAFYEAVRG